MLDGKVQQPDVVARALRQCLGRGRWPRVVLALPGHQLRDATVAMPVSLSAQAWPDWVESEAKRLTLDRAGAAEALHYDACPVPSAEHSVAQSAPGFYRVVAAAGRFVDDRLAVAERAGLRTVAIDAEHYALQRAFVWGGAAPPRPACGTSILAWLDDTRLVLSLFDGAQCLGECSVALDMAAAGTAAGWGRAVRSALAQWQTRLPSAAMPAGSQLWLAGARASAAGLGEAVAAACKLPVALVDPFDGCAVSPDAVPLPPPCDRPAYLLACGLAMHGEIA